MTNVIERVTVSGFWGNKTVEIQLQNSLNFIIGVNGSGKTTFIDLLSAALRMDFEALIRIPFTEINIVLKTVGKNQKPVIRLKKTFANEYLAQLTYYLKPSASGEVTRYDFDDFADIRMMRKRRVSPRSEAEQAGLQEKLSELIQLSWLPLWRSHISTMREGVEERHLPSIDAKLAQVTRDFATYFSSLQTQAQRETDLFQEKIFLSLISVSDRRSINLNSASYAPTEQSELEAVFNEFKLDKQKTRRSIFHHFERFRVAADRWKADKAIDADDLVTLYDNQRIKRILFEWRRLQMSKERIYSERNAFVEILNKLFSRKSVQITDRNEVQIVTQSGTIFSPAVLSSGEKQLFIMLGEVLLYEQRPFVFIADEPELSLHVGWQSELVSSIQTLNPRVQIVFATHSPDIVGENSKNLIQIEDHIR